MSVSVLMTGCMHDYIHADDVYQLSCRPIVRLNVVLKLSVPQQSLHASAEVPSLQ